MIKATNISQGRLVNVWVVFEEIHRNGPVSRSHIAELTGLSKQAISNLVNELQEEGFIQEEKPIINGVGKPSTPLTINPSALYSIGLHLDFGRLFVVATDLNGRVLVRQTHLLETRAPEHTLEPVAALVDNIIALPQLGTRKLLGIGLAMPGLFGVAGLGPTRLRGWNGVAFSRLLAQRLGRQVSFNSESTASAIAEQRFGCARPFNNFAYIFVGNGVGTGLIIDGRPVIGATGNAGDFGHVIVRPHGRECICGKKGCLETYISSASLIDNCAPASATMVRQEDKNAYLNSPAFARWLDDTAEPFRTGINIIENLLDPETIIVGGDVPGWLIDELLGRLKPLYPSPGSRQRNNDRVLKGLLGEDVAAIGAAALSVYAALDPFYSEPELL